MVKMLSEIKESAAGIRSAKLTNAAVLGDAVKAIRKKKPKSVVIAARGTSDHAGYFGKYLFEVYCGLPVALASCSVYTLYEGNMSLKDCLVIGISQSGKAADVCEVVKRANEQGAVTVTVTNDASSPLAELGAFHLDCSQTNEVSVAATKTFVSQIYLMTALAAKLSGNAFLRDTLKTLPAVLERTYKLEGQVEELAKRYRFINDSFVLGRGFAFPLALEFALKTQETCYIRSRGYATSDFYHGPIAMISDNTPVFLFALEDTTKADSEKMIDSLRSKGAEVMVFTSDEDILAKADTGIVIPGKNFLESVFAAAAAMQMFACKLSLLRGLNPDSPRGLSKVTITK